MPTYAYACTECDHRFEAVQSFSDDALTVCPECEGRLRKVFSNVGVVFKGSGFYRNDSRTDGKGKPSSGSSGSSESRSESKAESSGSSSKSSDSSSSSSSSGKSESSSSGSSGSSSSSGAKPKDTSAA